MEKRARIENELIYPVSNEIVFNSLTNMEFDPRNNMILWEDADFLVVHKPAGLPTTPSQQGKACLEAIFPGAHAIHRLDQRVSGLVWLGKSKAATALGARWFQEGRVEKTYRAVVGQLPQLPSPLKQWLKQAGTKALITTKAKPGYDPAELSYQILQSSERYHLLEIHLKTGRFHQIRAQLSASGAPIVGDVKYGYRRTTPDGSIFLQAAGLAFAHPKTGIWVNLQLPLPALWAKYGFTNLHTPAE